MIDDKTEPYDVLPQWISDELRLQVWHGDVPGRTTEEKIKYLFDLFKTSKTISDEALKQTPRMESDDTGVPYPLPLPADTVLLDVIVDCKDCTAEGPAEMFLTSEGWILPDYSICPLCGCTKLIPIHKLPNLDGL